MPGYNKPQPTNFTNNKTIGKTNNNKTKGFTIIEVVLVLAIAGLIFLVVFLALPALQKSQRDNARKQDVAKVIAGLQQYYADNGKAIWSSVQTGGMLIVSTGYISNLAQTTAIRVAMPGSCAGAVGSNYIQYVNVRVGCTCDNVNSNSSPDNPSWSSKYAAIYSELENGPLYCKDLQL